MRYGELSRAVREHVDQSQRFAHIVRVARFAERLAFAHGESSKKARFAGMLHDLARLYSGERLLRECSARELAPDEFERNNPVVLHANIAAELARERFGVEDPVVLSAIRKHTLGAPQMSPVDEIVFLADALEPGRSYPEREEIARLAFSNLGAAMYRLLASTLDHLRERGLKPSPKTLAAFVVYQSLARAGNSAHERSSLSA